MYVTYVTVLYRIIIMREVASNLRNALDDQVSFKHSRGNFCGFVSCKSFTFDSFLSLQLQNSVISYTMTILPLKSTYKIDSRMASLTKEF